jgi:preprotein translocase subunit Sec61beta
MFSNLVAAEEPLRDIGIDPYAVGAIALAILVVLMLALLSFGKGREHS